MSLSMTLVPLAIAVLLTANGNELGELIKNKKDHMKSNTIPNLESEYMDANLLTKTLVEHGLKVEKINENHIMCSTIKGKLVFKRGSETENFKIDILDVDDVEGIICDLELLKEEYNSNTQTFTYNKLISELEDNNMKLESEEILDDNSIELIISI